MARPKGRLSLIATLTSAAVLLACVVVGLGAFTRLVHAGLGCPDWPGCYGHLTWPTSIEEVTSAEARFPEFPVEQDKTWPEMVHRYCAGSLGLLVLSITILMFLELFKQQKLPPATSSTSNHKPLGLPIKHSLIICFVIVVQAAFGMWTVTLKLWPQVVTAHLLGGFATLSLLWLLRLRLQSRLQPTPNDLPGTNDDNPPVGSGTGKLFSALLALIVLQIALGGWTSANYAALACPDFPTCHNQWWPQADFAQGFNIGQTIGPNYLGGLLDGPARTAIHLSHRMGAVVVALFTIFCLFQLSKIRRFNRDQLILALLLTTQLCLGMANIVFSLPLFIAVAHNGVGAMFLLAVIRTRYRIYHCFQTTVPATHSTPTRGIRHDTAEPSTT